MEHKMLEYSIFNELSYAAQKIKEKNLTEESPIMGLNALLESIEFVNLILELEEFLEVKHGIVTDLYDEVLNKPDQEMSLKNLVDIVNKNYFE